MWHNVRKLLFFASYNNLYNHMDSLNVTLRRIFYLYYKYYKIYFKIYIIKYILYLYILLLTYLKYKVFWFHSNIIWIDFRFCKKKKRSKSKSNVVVIDFKQNSDMYDLNSLLVIKYH